MKRLKTIFYELIGSVRFSTAYLKRDSVEIRQRVQEDLARINCCRILVMLPVLLLMNIHNICNISRFHPNPENVNAGRPIFDLLHPAPKVSFGANLFMITVLCCYGVLIIRYLFFNKEREQEKTGGYKLLYRTFWGFWIFGIVGTSLEQILFGRGMLFYILICMIICLVPLYSIMEFFCILLIGVLLASGSFIHFGPNIDIKIFLYSYLVMFIIGFIAQRFQVDMWTLQEYVYVNTFIDPLTRLLNRRGGNALFSSELHKAKKDSALGVIMLDIDFFKRYNDSLGHDAGDVCLQTVSRCINQAVAERTKIVIRHGGEEFVVILIGADADETKKWAEKIRRTVFEAGLPAPCKKAAEVVTVSVGAAVIKASAGDRYENLLEMADQALYQAKDLGRNQVAFRSQMNEKAFTEASMTALEPFSV